MPYPLLKTNQPATEIAGWFVFRGEGREVQKLQVLRNKTMYIFVLTTKYILVE